MKIAVLLPTLLLSTLAFGQGDPKKPLQTPIKVGEEGAVPAPRIGGEAKVQIPVKAPFVHDEEASAVVAAAAKEQTPEGVLDDVKSFQASFKITRYERKDGTGPIVAKTGNIIWQWLKKSRASDRSNFYLRTLMQTDDDLGTTLALGPTGPWIHEEGEKKQPMMLTGAEFEEDRKQLEEERDRTEELIGISQIGNLLGKDARFRFVSRGVELPIRGRSILVDVVERDAPNQKRALTLRIGVEDHRLYGATFGPTAEGFPTETLEFDTHRFIEIPGETKTVLMPNTVVIYRNGERQLMALAKAPTDLKLNTNLKRNDFKYPGR